MDAVDSVAKVIYERFLPVLNECFGDLNTMSTAGDDLEQCHVKEFICKLKYLENELLLISTNLAKALTKNEVMNKELEKEKQKCRKKSMKIKELETKLNNTEFKLKVRLSNETNKKTAIVSKDAAIQNDTLVDKSKDFAITMKSLRETAQTTLDIIRNIADGSDSDDLGEQEEVFKKNPNCDKISQDFQRTIDVLKKENDDLKASICSRSQNLNSELVVNDNFNPSLSDLSTSATDYSSTLSDSSFSGVISNDSGDNCSNSKWNDPNFPRNLVKSMQRKVKRLKNHNLKLSVGSEEGLHLQKQFGHICTEFNERHRMIQQKIDYYFES